MALVAPVIFLFFFALIVFMQAHQMRDLAQYAAYCGARAAIMPGAVADDARGEAEGLLTVSGIRDFNVDVAPEDITNSTSEITVTVDVPIISNLWVITPWLPENWTTSSSITLRREIRRDP